MRLINASTLTLVEFFEPTIPEYAILSHTWEDGEVSFQEMGVPSARQAKQGFTKIKRACETTLSLGLEHIWVDTCCIDKTSNAELTESINSMFEWYRKSRICLVFLADYGADHNAPLSPCRWFSRGWTLQELLAPICINFYSSTWELVGTRASLAARLSETTRIPILALFGPNLSQSFSVAERMSWAADRKTTRVEDRAYSLLGLFNINMPMLYGEGTNAFRRLQEEIIKRTNDLTILAWRPESSGPPHACPALAADPDSFRGASDVQRSLLFEMPTSLTNRGLQLVQRRLFLLRRDRLRKGESGFQYLLEVGRRAGDNLYVCIPLRRVGFGIYFRENQPAIIMFRDVDRYLFQLTVPHKFLLVTDMDAGIPSSVSDLCRKGDALHGAIYIAPPSSEDCYSLVPQSPIPEAAYDHATGLAFLPRGIGLEVFACEFVVTLTEPPFRTHSVRFGILVASRFVARSFAPYTTLAVVDSRTQEAQMVFLLMGRNPDEPMSWLQVLQLLGRQVKDDLQSLSIRNEHAGSVVDISGRVDTRPVVVDGEACSLPCLQISIRMRDSDSRVQVVRRVPSNPTVWINAETLCLATT